LDFQFRVRCAGAHGCHGHAVPATGLPEMMELQDFQIIFDIS
jgi:hypothetical protein